MLKIPLSEINFSFSRSSGPGGQNVNKVETKATLYWNFEASACLSEFQKQTLRNQHDFRNKLDKEGQIIISDQTSRSKETNKQNCILRLEKIVAAAIKPRKKRRKTSVPRAAKEKRLKVKKNRSEKLRNRRIDRSG